MGNEDFQNRQLSEIAVATKSTEEWSWHSYERLGDIKAELKGATFEAEVKGCFGGFLGGALRVSILAILSAQLFVGNRIMKALDARTNASAAPQASTVQERQGH
ncbi:MAG TPA: hypothetical protein VEN81_14770 [Planctomycetota bacterium]|nr:hypothetical protein [Planctomycetota bacterium]